LIPSTDTAALIPLVGLLPVSRVEITGASYVNKPLLVPTAAETVMTVPVPCPLKCMVAEDKLCTHTTDEYVDHEEVAHG